MKQLWGYTLLEMLIVMAISAMLFALGLRFFNTVSAEYQDYFSNSTQSGMDFSRQIDRELIRYSSGESDSMCYITDHLSGDTLLGIQENKDLFYPYNEPYFKK